MNYRHQYHAGNAADVFKHSLLIALVGAMQRKDKGCLFLDTHAGRGSYDLSQTTILPDGRERAPEWPDGVGRVWDMRDGPLAAFAGLVRKFNRARAGGDGALQYYPGSPRILAELARSQDRLVFCELREEDADAVAHEFRAEARASVRQMDGYEAMRALLPPPERRGLVLIDPPFESKGEFADVLDSLREGLRRFAQGILAVWYPITERARADEFHGAVAAMKTPALAVELTLAGESAPVRMKGCGLLVMNPPWRIEDEFRAIAAACAGSLAREDSRSSARCEWIVPDA